MEVLTFYNAYRVATPSTQYNVNEIDRTALKIPFHNNMLRIDVQTDQNLEKIWFLEN